MNKVDVKKIKGKMLTEEQVLVVSQMIKASFIEAFSRGRKLTREELNDLEGAATPIINAIIHNVQTALLQGATFDEAVKNSTPKKRKTKKVTK